MTYVVHVSETRCAGDVGPLQEHEVAIDDERCAFEAVDALNVLRRQMPGQYWHTYLVHGEQTLVTLVREGGAT